VSGSFRLWRWIGATALLAAGLVMGSSVAGVHEARSAAAPAPTAWSASGTTLPASQAHTSPGHFVTPLVPHEGGGTYNADSTNWSGQLATGATFTGVRGDWTVPTVQLTPYSSVSSSWIGIDGGPDSPNSIIQTGTAQDVQDGQASYYAWYELFPSPPVDVGAVSPGDQMQASISQFAGTWTLTLTDASSGGSVTIHPSYSGPAASAEWIEELQTVVGAQQPTLANFGSVQFTQMQATTSAGSPGLTAVNMIDQSGNTIATAGSIVANSFTDTYVPSPRGYWLVGSDGGIFSFGQAQFYGSTGSLHLQRPVVGIVPTADHGGYWLDASDGGVFSYGDTQFYGSIPGLGLHPAGSGLPNSLNAPIVGMVPSIDDGGYFMVASDGGVFAFGDAHFAGSCPGIGGCAGKAVAVMPDHSGNGYWLVTATGNVYTFGDAPYFGAPGQGTVTSAVATPDGLGYLILLSDGVVLSYGSAPAAGSPPVGDFPGLDGATSIFGTSDGFGYWVSSALGGVYNFGDAPNDGGMTGTHLNGSIVAATGF
jgi:Peptidase A4 family